MGKKDAITKEYVRNPKVFADAFNQFIFHGKQRIVPEQLQELDSLEMVIPYGTDGVGVPEQRYRDVMKMLTVMTDGETAFCILGIESQSEIHYAMPVRNGVYDFLQLAHQVTEAARSHRESRQNGMSVRPTRGEYLSGFWKSDKLLPVITLVIYFGNSDWDAPLSLKEMYSCDNEDILQYVADYHVNLMAPGRMSKEEIDLFQSSLREVMLYIKYAGDKKELDRLIEENEVYKQLDKDAAEVINAVTDSKLWFEKEEERVNMCVALDEMREESRQKGRVEQTIELIIDLLAELGSVPQELTVRIQEEQELQILKSWFKLAAKADSIETFESQM